MPSSSLRFSKALELHFKNTKPAAPKVCTLYSIESLYNNVDPYWVEHIRTIRFKEDGTEVRQVLYRPTIVNEIVDKISTQLGTRAIDGVFVTGPQGIGKSFSLVNTVIKLESTGKYLVTFFPDSDEWRHAGDVVKDIANSIGIQDITLFPEMNKKWKGEEAEIDFENLIDVISTCLANMNPPKQWVFVFDQINKLFLREKKSSISELTFPSSLITRVMKKGRVISVISASANDEVANVGQHEKFLRYSHCIRMSRDELKLAFEDCLKANNDPEGLLSDTERLTNGVPLYASKFLGKTCAGNEAKFLYSQIGEIIQEWTNLHEKVFPKSAVKWEQISYNMITAYFDLQYKAYSQYDRKHFVVTEDKGKTKISPLFPVVFDAIREHFWSILVHYLDQHTTEIVVICNMEETTGDVLGRLFEFLVIKRSLVNKSTLYLEEGEAITIPNILERFDGKALPDVSSDSVTYVPNRQNFPAIDFLWKVKERIIGVQVHTSTHKDVGAKFEKMCKEAGWIEKKTKEPPNNLYLLYLCHDASVKRKVDVDFSRETPNKMVKVFAKTVDEIEGLNKNPVWWWFTRHKG
jgi:hypothetical protein